MKDLTKHTTQVALVAESIPDVFRHDPLNGLLAEANRDQLIPVATCKAMLDRLSAVAGSSPDEARLTAANILACYGTERRDPTELAALMSLMQSDLETVPSHLHKSVLDSVTKTERFFPTRTALAAAIAEVMTPYNTARRIAERHLWRHKILTEQAQPQAPVDSEGLRRTVGAMPKTSTLAATVAASLCRLDGRDPVIDAEVVDRMEAVQQVQPPAAPSTGRPVVMTAEERRAALAAGLKRGVAA